MTTRKFAFEVQSSLKEAHGIDLKRSHVHEVLAALFGFASYTALTTQWVLAQHDGSSPAGPLDLAGAASRALDLGYQPPMPAIIAALTAGAAETERLAVFTVDDILAALDIEGSSDEPDEPAEAASGDRDTGIADPKTDDAETDDDWERWHDERLPSIDLDSAVLRESLVRMADAGVASAHLALAQLEEEAVEDGPTGAGDGSYWFEQQQSGRVLTGVELEWAEAYRLQQAARKTREVHLRLASSVGSAEAALRRAEEEPGVETFERAAGVAGSRHAGRLGELALSLGREKDARTWFRVAAQQGDIEAMKTLASELEPDLKDAWTWVHLAKLLGTDIMANDVVGDDDLSSDADEAGPIYAEGGLELDPLPGDVDVVARRRARALYEAIDP